VTALVPAGFVTVTSTVVVPGGAVAVRRPEELTVKLDAATEPNLTAAAPEKPAPVMDIGVPPVEAPEIGLTPATEGVLNEPKVNLSALLVALVPFGVVTVTSTVVPTVPAGEVAVIWVGETTLKPPALVAPNLTAVAAERLSPVIVTAVPPPGAPEAGLTPVTAGCVDW